MQQHTGITSACATSIAIFLINKYTVKVYLYFYSYISYYTKVYKKVQ